MLNYSFRSFGFPHKQARAKLSFERVSEQQSQARGFPVLDLEAMDRDSSLPQYSIGKRGRRTQIAANVECIMKGLEILSPPIKSQDLAGDRPRARASGENLKPISFRSEAKNERRGLPFWEAGITSNRRMLSSLYFHSRLSPRKEKDCGSIPQRAYPINQRIASCCTEIRKRLEVMLQYRQGVKVHKMTWDGKKWLMLKNTGFIESWTFELTSPKVNWT